jgi:hypothetical protein
MPENEPDLYRKLLALPDGKRPPSYYELLGVTSDEHDADVIAEAALMRSSHLDRYRSGEYAEECERILNEIATATEALCDPRLRSEYDRQRFSDALQSAELGDLDCDRLEAGASSFSGPSSDTSDAEPPPHDEQPSAIPESSGEPLPKKTSWLSKLKSHLKSRVIAWSDFSFPRPRISRRFVAVSLLVVTYFAVYPGDLSPFTTLTGKLARIIDPVIGLVSLSRSVSAGVYILLALALGSWLVLRTDRHS